VARGQPKGGASWHRGMLIGTEEDKYALRQTSTWYRYSGMQKAERHRGRGMEAAKVSWVFSLLVCSARKTY